MRSILPWLLSCALAAVEGSIQFSDGRSEAGALFLANDLQIHLANQTLRVVPKDAVQELTLAIEREELAAQWRFPEPGKARKEIVGEPYPVRHFRAELHTLAGERLQGHLYTTVVHLQQGDTVTKVLVPAKQQGKAGETLASLVYPVRIAFTASATAAAGSASCALPAGVAVREAASLDLPDLVRLEARVAAGRLVVPSRAAGPRCWAWLSADGIGIRWPGKPDPALSARLVQAEPLVKDYWDDRQTLGCWRGDGDLVCSLIACRRSGSTTGDREAKPWRIEVWRWRSDPVGGGLLLAGKGYLLRGTGERPAISVEERP